MSSILKIDNLSHRYSGNWAIRDINLEISKTGVVGLLDPMVQESLPP